jgi:hypothetical protein
VIPAGLGTGDKRPGLLAGLMAAVRPEFRVGVLVFDPGDPVFGGPACRIRRCGRTARTAGMCNAHHQRWVKAGRPDQDASKHGGTLPGSRGLCSERMIFGIEIGSDYSLDHGRAP